MARRSAGRIRKRATFSALRTTPYRGRSGPVRAAYVPGGEGEEFPLVGFAIGRRCGHAVARNRLRRRIRSAVAELAPHLAAGSYLISSGPEATALCYPDLVKAVRKALVAAGSAAEANQ